LPGAPVRATAVRRQLRLGAVGAGLGAGDQGLVKSPLPQIPNLDPSCSSHPVPSPQSRAPDPMILIDNLHKSFKSKSGTVHAVKGVGFEARDGEITGLLGPNGAGKTTTLRMLYTLMSPDQGRIEVDGIDVARDPTSV